MKRHALCYVVAVSCLFLFLSGCGANVAQPSTTSTPSVEASDLTTAELEARLEAQAQEREDARAQAEADAWAEADAQAEAEAEAAAAAFDHSSYWEDSTGKKVGLTIELSEGVRGSDEATLDSLYSEAGGTPPTACFTGRESGSIDSWQIVPIQDTRVWVGTIMMSNLTPDFGWPGYMAINLGGGNVSIGLGYRDGPACRVRTEITWSQVSGPFVRVPLVLVQHDAFTPKTPDGGKPPVLQVTIAGMTTTSKTEYELPS